MNEADHERSLIDRARGGSVDAFDALMKMHQDRLFRFLVVRGMDPGDAEDVVQETFLSAYRFLDSYRPRWRFSTWLYTIARRIASRLPRREEVEFAPEAAATPDEHAAHQEQRGQLWDTARAVLSREQFSALWLYYGEEFDIREVARVLNRSRAWVKVNLHRARNRLATELESNELGRNVNDEPIRT